MPSFAAQDRLQSLSALVAVSALLAACGGGGGGSGSIATPPPAASLSINGTAAKGAAIAGAAVDAKCNGGTGTATTLADGSYTINLTVGSLPCVLKVSTASGDLYSVATGTGATVTANITPFTQLIVAGLAGKDPTAYFAGFGASDIAGLTASAVVAAQTAVVTVLTNSGINTSALPISLVSGSLVAASGSATGNAYDQALDALNTKLTSSGTTLAALTNAVVITSPVAPPPSTNTASVPTDLLLQPKEATCAALRSGTYRLLVPQIGAAGTHGDASTQKLTFNAATPSVTNAAGQVFTLTPTAGSPCRFLTSGGGDIVVSQSGAFAIYTSDGLFGIGFPEQTIALSDLAGEWNFLQFDRANTTDPLGPKSVSGPISSAGVLSPTSYCDDAKSCVTTGLPTIPLTVNAAGGFNFNFSSTGYSRFFAFRTGSGDLMLAGTGEDGTFGFGTIRRTNGLPAVGTVNTFWSVDAINQLTGNTYAPQGVVITDGSNTITSIDAANDRFTRDQVTNFTTNPVTTRPETIYANAVAGTARQGFRWRQPGATTNSAGASVNVPEFVQLPLRGTGLTVSLILNANVAASRFSVSVAKP
jgi:hypothetical protein